MLDNRFLRSDGVEVVGLFACWCGVAGIRSFEEGCVILNVGNMSMYKHMWCGGV